MKQYQMIGIHDEKQSIMFVNAGSCNEAYYSMVDWTKHFKTVIVSKFVCKPGLKDYEYQVYEKVKS